MLHAEFDHVGWECPHILAGYDGFDFGIAPGACCDRLHFGRSGSSLEIAEVIGSAPWRLGKITIKHGPLKQFDMEDGMTMVFRAQDPTMLKAVKIGDKVKFMPERINGQFTVTRIQKSK